jgi:hypothetical protein
MGNLICTLKTKKMSVTVLLIENFIFKALSHRPDLGTRKERAAKTRPQNSKTENVIKVLGKSMVLCVCVLDHGAFSAMLISDRSLWG